MDVRFFFLNGETKDVKIQTYYKGKNNNYLIVPVTGRPYEIHGVKEMIKIK